MKTVHLRKFDLNHLTALDALLVERNIARGKDLHLAG